MSGIRGVLDLITANGRNKNSRMVPKGLMLFACLVLAGMLAGCGREDINITITDCRTQTRLAAKPGQTVRQLLEEAEITVGGSDEISPDLDTKITSNDGHITIQRYAKVSVETEEGSTEVELTGGRVQDALQQAGVTLLENDYVNHDLNAYLTDGMSVSVVHRCSVFLTVDGKTEHYLTQAHTVEELLQEQDITLGELDRIKPKRSGRLEDGTKVVVKRVEVKEVEVTEPVIFETEVTYSAAMLVGTSKITREGTNGEKLVTYQVTYVDGKEESRKAIKEKILKEPLSQLVLQGSKPKGKTVVSKESVDDCDGSGHGYYIITYSDGSVEYQDY
ncbi:MAG: ubiquitin-like domain-containing protein [Clostridium sp.]|nr:ubiquitin-like domain-containing protein [Clostridium sp.]